ncbi:group III truncated hemoglobin [Massilia cavernae]|uniref:Group III truncated hemoglobin n=1 Tax=Massilia cavernae TaxID=2320864 RepID=A0A418Y8D5_9BURK|nr:group III truncated hemoglobin [Massilia cavernae]RJG27663.1 group III truncated hemoglobin [Massilia cavernae]
MYDELNKAAISELVHEFYGDVRRDPQLLAIFDAAIGDNWTAHLGRMVEFWSTVMLATHEFKGNVYGTHMAIGGVVPDHFQRWLALFEAAARRLFVPALAEEFLVVARRIAASLQYGFFGSVEVH